MGARSYTPDSVQRALQHHELTGALSSVSPPYPGRPKWRIRLASAPSSAPTEFTLREAYVLCLGLAEGERAYGGKARRNPGASQGCGGRVGPEVIDEQERGA